MENNIMNRPQPHCPVVEINGKIAKGNQFDLDIRLPEDNREVIYGVIKDSRNNPVKDAVVKLVEVERKDCKEKRKPVSHTFTDKHGEFVFGPLCPNKEYAIDIWLDNVRHFKVCAECKHEGKCLKGEPMDKYDDKYEDKYEDKYSEKYEDKCENKYDDKYESKCENICDHKYDNKYENKYDDNYDSKCEDKYENKCENKHEDKCENKHENKCEEKKDKCEKHEPCKCEPMNKYKPSCRFNSMDKYGYMMNKR